MDGGRISGSYSAKPRKKKNLSRERVGTIKLSVREMASVCLRHGVPVVVSDRGALGRNPIPTWDISNLGSDQLLALWAALGVRIWGRGSETTTRGTAIDAVAA